MTFNRHKQGGGGNNTSNGKTYSIPANPGPSPRSRIPPMLFYDTSKMQRSTYSQENNTSTSNQENTTTKS